jgi:hypothetical protein
MVEFWLLKNTPPKKEKKHLVLALFSFRFLFLATYKYIIYV